MKYRVISGVLLTVLLSGCASRGGQNTTGAPAGASAAGQSREGTPLILDQLREHVNTLRARAMKGDAAATDELKGMLSGQGIPLPQPLRMAARAAGPAA